VALAARAWGVDDNVLPFRLWAVLRLSGKTTKAKAQYRLLIGLWALVSVSLFVEETNTMLD